MEDCNVKEDKEQLEHHTSETIFNAVICVFFFLKPIKTMKSAFLTRLYIFGIYAAFIYGEKCGQSEYLSAADECCPMCAMGSVVMKDCHGDYSTRCKPCSKGTFMNEPNGLQTCFQCKICENGLFISQDCTNMKDTICGVLDGYYCKHFTDDRNDCSLAIKHSKCKPGEQINTPGTKASDTVCEPCSPGFYSPEGVNCSKWTDCSVRNEIEDEEGTSIRDVQCKPRRNRYGLIAAFLTAAVVVLLSLAVLCLCQRKAVRSFFILKIPVEETDPQSSQCAPSTSPLKDNQETESRAVQADCNKEHTVQGEPVPISGVIGHQGRIHPGRSANPSQGTQDSPEARGEHANSTHTRRRRESNPPTLEV